VTAKAIERRLRALRDPLIATHHLRFFKCGPGEYGEGDAFLGIMVPALRRLSKEFTAASVAEAFELLQSKWHEARILALMILVRKYERGDEATREEIYRGYLANTDRINNWDLVDVSAPNIVGAYLLDRDRAPLYTLARSASLWERRIAIISTQHCIRQGDFHDTLRIAEILFDDRQDLIHKATGVDVARSRQTRSAGSGTFPPQARATHAADDAAVRDREVLAGVAAAVYGEGLVRLLTCTTA
jgi:3-methyladenine DNA glycosylase AlkD